MRIYDVRFYNADGEADGYFAELSEKELDRVQALLGEAQRNGHITDLEIYPIEDNVISGKDLLSEIMERFLS